MDRRIGVGGDDNGWMVMMVRRKREGEENRLATINCALADPEPALLLLLLLLLVPQLELVVQ